MKCSCIPGRFICGEDGSVGESYPLTFQSERIGAYAFAI